jgi:excisionase family DNA binding protein
MTRDSVTLEVRRGTRPETVLAAIREQAPGLLREAPQKPPPDSQGGRKVDPERLLTPAEVAALFRVDAKTVTRWAQEGRLTFIRTLGGHRRYYEAEVRALMAGLTRPGGRGGDGE